MKILMLSEPIPPNNPGGAGKFAWDIFRELSSLGIQVDLITTAPSRQSVQIIGESRVFTLAHNLGGWNLHSLNTLNEAVLTAATVLAETEKYDLLYDCGGFLYFDAFCRLASTHGIPSITHVLINLALYLNETRVSEHHIAQFARLQGMQCGASKIVITTSNFERLACAKLYGINSESVTLCWNAIQMPKIAQVEVLSWRSKLAEPDSILLLFGGRIGDKVKGVDRALAFVSALCARGIKIRLITTSLDDTEISVPGFTHKIMPLGRLADNEMPSLYSAVDAFLAPSRYEAFGLMALEVASCGTQVIASETGGHLDLAKHLPIHLLGDDEWENPSSIAVETVQKCHDSLSKLKKTYLPDVFSMSRCANQLHEIFQTLVGIT